MGGSAALWWLSVCRCSTVSCASPRTPIGTSFAMEKMYQIPRPEIQKARLDGLAFVKQEPWSSIIGLAVAMAAMFPRLFQFVAALFGLAAPLAVLADGIV